MGNRLPRKQTKYLCTFLPLSRAEKEAFCFPTQNSVLYKGIEVKILPSKAILTEKQAYVAALNEKISGSVAGVVVDYKGITVANDTKLRKELREAGVEYAVVKNTMLRLALKGTAYEGMEDCLSGTTAFAFSNDDAIAPARILNKFAEASKGAYSIKAGYMDGKVMSADEVKQIANLPSREGLLSMLCSALQGTIRGLAVALNAVAEQKGEVA